MVRFKKISAISLISLTIILCFGFYVGNPIVPFVGMADPHIYIFNGKAYLYSTRDADSTSKAFVNPDWKIWSSDDLVNWKLERTISPKETYIGESNNCWAPEVAYKNGKYYFYFSNGNLNTGVMKSDSPSGPFVDALGKPMLHQSLTPGKEYDPTILVEKDEENTAYIVFGHYAKDNPNLSYYIAKLNHDMVSLAEEPRKLTIIGDADVLKENDKPNLHKRNGIYYLSAGSHYATSKNIYGPYTRVGNSGTNKYGLNNRAHGTYFDWNNQSFHTWCHFHLGLGVARYRESYISYLHYKNNGEMVTDEGYLDAHFATGVGQYDASWNKIEAEWYMAANDIQKRECVKGGFEIQNIKNNSSLYYPNVKNLGKINHIQFHLSSDSDGGIIEVYANKLDGKLLGKVKIDNTGGFGVYKDVNCKLVGVTGVKSIYLKFKGENRDLLHLNWFKFI